MNPDASFLALRLEVEQLEQVFCALQSDGYEVYGPVLRDGAIVLDRLLHADGLPVGVTDDQEAGHYRIRARSDKAVFGYVNGPQSFKKFLHPSRLRLFSASRTDSGFTITSERDPSPKLALIGVRSCDLAAMALQSHVFASATQPDPSYAERHAQAFIIAVSCTEAGETCFCTSMGTGPRARTGFDLALTEVLNQDEHYFVVEPGSDRGVDLLGKLECRTATEAEKTLSLEQIERAKTQMGRTLETSGLKERIWAHFNDPRWEDIASRCLSCANCTLVCPTCFCTTTEEVTDLTGQHAERWRRWDSCFTKDFSYIHGGHVRQSVSSRYRQWMTHKLSTWHDQFGSSGCVGCGRCIAWCPVGIDLTQEAEAFRLADLAVRPAHSGPINV